MIDTSLVIVVGYREIGMPQIGSSRDDEKAALQNRRQSVAESRHRCSGAGQACDGELPGGA
jgi:hypothetical protein